MVIKKQLPPALHKYNKINLKNNEDYAYYVETYY